MRNGSKQITLSVTAIEALAITEMLASIVEHNPFAYKGESIDRTRELYLKLKRQYIQEQ